LATAALACSMISWRNLVWGLYRSQVPPHTEIVDTYERSQRSTHMTLCGQVEADPDRFPGPRSIPDDPFSKVRDVSDQRRTRPSRSLTGLGAAGGGERRRGGHRGRIVAARGGRGVLEVHAAHADRDRAGRNRDGVVRVGRGVVAVDVVGLAGGA